MIVVHQGPGEESGALADTIWSCQWDLSSSGAGTVRADGVTFNVFTTEPEYIFNEGDMTIGVFCHETGHVLGLPDLYDVDGETSGAGIWSIMAGGSWCSADGYTDTSDGSRPAPLLAWERYRIGGSDWLNETELSGLTAQNIEEIESTHSAYRVTLKDGLVSPSSSSSPNNYAQYLLLEGKMKSSEGASSTSGKWYVAGTGILVTQIHEGVVYNCWDSTGLNTVSSGSSYIHGVNIVEAGSSDYGTGYLKYGQGLLWTAPDSYVGSADDLFSYAAVSRTLYDTIAYDLSNTRYYTSYSSITSKTGTSGVSLAFTKQTTFPMTVTVTAPQL